MTAAFRIGQPEQLPLAGLQARERRPQKRLRLNALQIAAHEYRQRGFRNVLNRRGLRAAPVVAQEVCGYAKQVASAGDFTMTPGSGCAEEADVTFLKQVVRQGGVSGDA